MFRFAHLSLRDLVHYWGRTALAIVGIGVVVAALWRDWLKGWGPSQARLDRGVTYCSSTRAPSFWTTLRSRRKSPRRQPEFLA